MENSYSPEAEVLVYGVASGWPHHDGVSIKEGVMNKYVE